MKHQRFVPTSRFQPWQRLGLRARITILFALGGLLLSVIMALATLYLTRQNLLTQRESDAIDRLSSDASNLNSKLTPGISPESVQALLLTLSTSQGSLPLVQIGDRPAIARDQSSAFITAPPSLEQLVLSQKPGRIRTVIDGEPMLVLGVPLRFGVQYYEAVPLSDIESTLRSVSYILLGSSAATAALAALLGVWASRRMLRPLAEVSAAAEAIASGNLDTRLVPPADRDLASLTASFNEMVGALQERIERDARFASEVSHELRSPLMTLTASVEVLETRRDELPERAQTAVDLLSSDLDRFKQLVEDLLEISRFDVGTASLELDEINVVEFVRQATARASDEPIPIIYDPAMAHTFIRADKRRIARVVSNLIDNAAKYGDGATRIDILDLGDAMQIAVEDNGPGVPLSERIVIFDRFSRGGAGGRRGADSGVGLGLSLVTEHVHLHGGRVWVEDRSDGHSGARFVVELPIDPELVR
ncbi:MAG TPA: HAMP domain-containing sensor histidine kinase [Acidimicrobiales bacterium]|nr:HAMP domain-containing sensor histidine kinase [Acidimicrobiales bacterium]